MVNLIETQLNQALTKEAYAYVNFGSMVYQKGGILMLINNSECKGI